MRFFKPSKKFLSWLAKHAGQRVLFDVGCGDGFLVLALSLRNVRAVGIEPRWFELKIKPMKRFLLASSIFAKRGEHCKVLQQTPNTLVLFCRPCHDGFVGRVAKLLPPTAEVLYISSPCNLGRDFALSEFDVEVVKEAPPCDEETVFRLKLKEPHDSSDR